MSEPRFTLPQRDGANFCSKAVSQMAAISRVSAVAIGEFAQRRLLASVSPHLRHYGGCSRISRRTLWRKSRHSVAVHVLAAVNSGDKLAKIENLLQFSH